MVLFITKMLVNPSLGKFQLFRGSSVILWHLLKEH